ncbi:MAG: hypothetical protein [Betatorquevirus homini30]|uniref:Hepatitis TT virus Orf2/Gyrovirus Vp2 N-terminal domain-containing protein n=1 Tax=Anelloviridae sp. TaxID=2055263 RepID=A0A385E4N0_9VIRU|nr:MAG: hypothetical protein QKC65_gp3 [Anelloviridae sp.]AXQ65619.1 MAG: hypothetical protein [Anelloviridae sp.]
MSKFLQPCLYTGRALNNQLLNSIISNHDLCCGCAEPIKHLKYLLESTCHTSEKTSEDTTNTEKTTTNDDPGFDAGDLERLFKLSDDDDR